MYNQFTTEATKVVYDTISSHPRLFEWAVKLVESRPAEAPKRLRTWMEEYVKSGTTVPVARELIEASLRQVRWNELRQVLQRDAKRYHS